MKLFIYLLLFTPILLSAQNPLDSLIHYVNKNDNNKIIQYGELSKKELEKYSLQKSDEKYLTIEYLIARSYISLQNYKKAEEILLKIVEVRKKKNSHITKDQALTLRSLTKIYTDQFNFKKAEQLYSEIYFISEKINLKETSFYANTLRIHSHSFIKQDSLVKARKYLKESIKAYNNITNLYDEDIIMAYYDLSEVCILLKLFPEVKDYLELILKITKGKNELNSYHFEALDLYANYYLELNNIKKAKLILQESIVSKKLEYGDNNNSLISSYNKLFDIYISENNFKQAEIVLIESLRLIKLNYGKHHSDYYTKTLQAAAFYFEQYPNLDKAAHYIFEFSVEFKRRLKNKTSYYTRNEMDIFMSNEFFYRYFPLSFIHSTNKNFPENNIEIFEIESIIKKFTLKNNELTNKIMRNSEDEILKKTHQEYININKEYSKSLLKSSEIGLIKLEQKIEKIEKKINALTFNQKESILFGNNIFDQIKGRLNKNEIVFELLNYYYFDKDDGKNSKGVFGAFIINDKIESPQYIRLFDDVKFDSILTKKASSIDLFNEIYQNQELYELFIKPVLNKINNADTIFIILDGKGNQINFAAIPINSNQILGDKYKVHLLGSSTDIINYKPTKFKQYNNLELLLYGDIDYDKHSSITPVGNDNIVPDTEDILTDLVSRSGISKWGYLAGTEKEVNTIKTQSDTNGYSARIINGEQATKSSILKLDGKTTPFVLHLATHGYFFENPKKTLPKQGNILTDKNSFGTTKASLYKESDDPMLRSGLLFAGANKYWGKPITKGTTDDGILTAKTISNLDLSACKLVVLSACETGLGDVKGSEGVFGLQRAFKMAGVNNIIMSLWKVPDAQTAELFELFYKECFKGKSIHESLRIAQAIMKEKYEPYYWAGFVLLE